MIVSGIVTKVKEERRISDDVWAVRCAARQSKGDDIFLNCILFGKLAQLVRDYVPVGGQMFVSGELQQEEYNGKNYFSVSVRSIEFVRGKQKSTKKEPKPPQDDGQNLDDEIPF